MKRKQADKRTRKPSSKDTPKIANTRIYTYNTLKDLLKKERDRINVYAAILDCSGVYYVKNVEKYVCTVKLIDETVNPHIRDTKSHKFMKVTMFSKDSSRLPQPAKVGSILRIHRGQTKKNKDELQLNCDVGIKGAWVLFDTDSNVSSISESGRSHTFIPKDKTRLKDIRNFAKNYFENHSLDGISLDAALKKKKDEFDTICYVLDIKKKGKTTRILLCDKSKIVKLFVPAKRTLPFTPSSIIRIRAVSYATHKNKFCLELNDYSNILEIPGDYKSAVEMNKSMESSKASKEVSEELMIYKHDLSTSVISHPTVKKSKVVHLKDLYSRNVGKSKDKSFHVTVNVMEIGPKNPLDWICVVDKNKNHYDYKDMKHKGGNVEYYLKLQLFVKDATVTTDNNLYMFFLCTVDGKGKEFIELPKGNKAPDDDFLKKLRKIYKTLIKPWSILDCVVEHVDTENGQQIFFLTNPCLDLD
jgi:hypothetical protein